MHELALSEGILDILTAQSRDARIGRVTRVVLEIGVLSGVEPEALRFCFDAVTRNSLADGAELHIESVGARGCCGACGREFPMAGFLEPCPHCAAYGVQPVAGMELRVREFEGI